MRKILLLMFALLAGVSGAWATVTMPTFTTDVNDPHYYTIKNYRSKKYAAYAGPSTQLAQVSSITMESLWYFVENDGGVYIVPAVDPSVKLVSNTSANATGAKWYLVENPHQSGYFCVSLSSTAANKCWDDNGTHTAVGYWQPAADDHEGTSWIIEESSKTLAEVIDYRRNQILPTINALPEVLKPSAKMTALNNAATDAEFREAVADFSANVTFLCRSGKYLEVGDAQGIISSTTKTNNSTIQLESVGDGSFYIKGYMSMKYMGDVDVSNSIATESSPTTPYYIQEKDGYAVARPTKWADSGWSNGYHYIHNGGSGCVGWESGNNNSQFTIEEVSLPSGYAAVTYNIELDAAVVVSETVRQATGSSSAVPSKYENDYTSYSYDVTTIPNASSATITVTATVSGLPFTPSTDYENATWYYMGGHISYTNPYKYISTNGDNLVWADNMSHTDAYRWAFIGNPITGFKIINRAAGSGKYMMETTSPVTMGTTATEWKLKNQPSFAKANASFGLWSFKRSQHANCQSGSVAYWGSFDQGSTFWVEAVDTREFTFEGVLAELKAINWSDVGAAGQLNRYNLTGASVGYAGNERALISGLETNLQNNGYDADAYNAAQGLIANYALNMPATGKFYRIKGNTSSKYLADGLASNSKFNMTTATDATTIFYFDGTKLTNLSSGMCNGMNQNAWAWVVGTSASTVLFQDGLTNGGYGIKSATCNFYDNGDGTNSADRGANMTINSSTNARYTNWYLEEVTTLPVTISTAKYATLYSPVALTIPTGVTAYTATDNGTVVTLTEIPDGIIPAEVGVILYADIENETTYNFSFSADAGTATSDLDGTYAAISKGANDYYLSNGTSGIGFYKSGTATVIPGFKAYLEADSSSPVKTFVFDSETAVKAIEAAQNPNRVVYDLNGRRVQNPEKGLYIVNGKKYLVK